MNETGHGFWTKDIEYYVMPKWEGPLFLLIFY